MAREQRKFCSIPVPLSLLDCPHHYGRVEDNDITSTLTSSIALGY